MAKSETTYERYKGQPTQLAQEPYDILAGWAVVCCLALGIALATWQQPPLRFGPEWTVQQPVKLAPGIRPVEGDEATLADDIGMVPKARE